MAFADHDEDNLVDEEVLFISLLREEFPNATFTTRPSTLRGKPLPYVVVKSFEADDSQRASGQRWIVDITVSEEANLDAKKLAVAIYAAMGKFGRETAGNASLGYITDVDRSKPSSYETADPVGREHLFHYAARYLVEVDY